MVDGSSRTNYISMYLWPLEQLQLLLHNGSTADPSVCAPGLPGLQSGVYNIINHKQERCNHGFEPWRRSVGTSQDRKHV